MPTLFQKREKATFLNDLKKWTDVVFLLRMQALNSFRYYS